MAGDAAKTLSNNLEDLAATVPFVHFAKVQMQDKPLLLGQGGRKTLSFSLLSLFGIDLPSICSSTRLMHMVIWDCVLILGHIMCMYRHRQGVQGSLSRV